MASSTINARYMGPALEALKAFGVTPDKVELAWHSENVTFHVTEAGTARDHVLRLHRPGYHTLGELNSERTWTGALASAGITVQAPRVTLEGNHFHAVDIPGSEQRYAGMTEWVEGTLLSDHLRNGAAPEDQRDAFRQIGTLAAAIHNQSEGWIPPAGFERHALDCDGLMGEAPFGGGSGNTRI